MTRVAGMPPILSEEDEEWLGILIQERFAIKMPITSDEFLNEIALQFGKCMLPNTLTHLLSRAPWCETVQEIRMDDGCVCCPEAAIDDSFDALENLLTGAPCNVIYNVAGVGFNEWAAAMRHAVAVPID
jgi:hypothetical protein